MTTRYPNPFGIHSNNNADLGLPPARHCTYEYTRDCRLRWARGRQAEVSCGSRKLRKPLLLCDDPTEVAAFRCYEYLRHRCPSTYLALFPTWPEYAMPGHLHRVSLGGRGSSIEYSKCRCLDRRSWLRKQSMANIYISQCGARQSVHVREALAVNMNERCPSGIRANDLWSATPVGDNRPTAAL